MDNQRLFQGSGFFIFKCLAHSRSILDLLGLDAELG